MGWRSEPQIETEERGRGKETEGEERGEEKGKKKGEGQGMGGEEE